MRITGWIAHSRIAHSLHSFIALFLDQDLSFGSLRSFVSFLAFCTSADMDRCAWFIGSSDLARTSHHTHRLRSALAFTHRSRICLARIIIFALASSRLRTPHTRTSHLASPGSFISVPRSHLFALVYTLAHVHFLPGSRTSFYLFSGSRTVLSHLTVTWFTLTLTGSGFAPAGSCGSHAYLSRSHAHGFRFHMDARMDARSVRFRHLSRAWIVFLL